MKSYYLQEQKPYNISEFKQLLEMSDSQYKIFLQELQQKRILKVSKDNEKYSLQFVGMLLFDNKFFFIFPKYINQVEYNKTVPQLLKLFREYSKREKLSSEEIETIGDNDPASYFNLLSTIIFLVEDYIENKLYENDKNVYILNGNDGEIDWNKTISDCPVTISDKNPIYLNFYINSTKSDENDYFRLLHMHVLNCCTSILEETNLGDYFDLPPINFDIDEGMFDAEDIILSKITSELSNQFITRKQKVLKAIASFITHYQNADENNKIDFYGTRNFEIIWEKVCGFVLNNQYENVREFIDKPIWKSKNGTKYIANTLKPDVISILEMNNEKYFMIFDAKYYNISLNDKVFENNPGIGDVSKQYLYQLAFKKFIDLKKVDVVHNIFLFPTESEYLDNFGEVDIDFLNLLGLNSIILLKVPSYKFFNMYINYKKVRLEEIVNFLKN